MPFSSIHPALGRALAARGYAEATAVQTAVAQGAVGADLLVSAQTGSGKTVAFGIAIASTLLGAEEQFAAHSEPLALIVAPTRELAVQVQRELDWLYAGTGARIVTCVGGMDVRAEARQLAAGAHIVVGTPGRLRDHLERNRLILTRLKSVVLDEADEMLDLGFREDLEFILDATPQERQTLMFSATMPRDIEALARRYQRDAVRIETARRDEQHADIEYRAIRVAPHDVENAVVNVLRLHEVRAALVFCSTREAVKRMHARLVERGFSAVALSGELTQSERTHALQALRDGRARVLVATDVAARGLDLPDLALVIHADLPNDRETLLHRSGRTGRAGRKGLCVLVVPFNRRRKAEVLLSAARLRVRWEPAPTADEIRIRDQERFLADPMFSEAPPEDDAAMARVLQAVRTPDEIANALVRMHRAQLPAPEDLTVDTGPPRRNERPGQGRERWSPELGSTPPEAERARPAHRERKEPRAADQDMVWFRLNIGRERNADPRWLLPLICRAGNVSKSEVGAIRIFDRDTRFQIAAEFADQFALHARTVGSKEGQISRIGPASGSAAQGSTPPAPPANGERSAASAESPVEAGPPKPEKRPYRAPFKPKAGASRDRNRKAFPPADPSTGPRLAASDRPRPTSRYARKKKNRAGQPASS
jgi:ATP-dependent RNA helicase DeaD